jgi:predicted DNA-binding transcriptional regulator
MAAFFEIRPRAKELGEALKKECPQNDCIIYRNLYNQYSDMIGDYRNSNLNFSDATVRALIHAVNKTGYEIESMYIENYAIQLYKREITRRNI